MSETAKQALKVFDRIEKSRVVAFNAYQRYTWRPGTHTGQQELKRWEKHQDIVDNGMRELRQLLQSLAAPHP